MSETVIREVAKDVWIFSRPFARFGIFPVGGRSTAIKMQGGRGVWILVSTPLDAETKAKVDQLGPVKFLVSPDAVHHLFLSEFKKAYPDAKLVAPKAATERVSDKSLKFDGVWGSDPEGTKYGFEEDVQHCYFSGFKNRDVAFFHPASKSMIQADLLFNLPPIEQYSKSKSSGRVPFVGNLGPFSWFHSSLTSSMSEDTEAMKRDVKTVASWDFERIIPCHGDVIESKGMEAWKAAYKSYLD
ncbi:hypothetical protein D9757_003895 [Collybiopsis confluens]|uniref:DUF4336 domain-containing protein n=1 Tax=Collybiopsis confluens TaxID=2823264 RepID=A0A8H5HUY4_9AGAR|nr:hypothetical protein D9757_003895 [Collybiopsis confluens]